MRPTKKEEPFAMLVCESCKEVRFGQAMSNAKCGHPTTQIGMMWCPDCAKTYNACEACGKPLEVDIPPHTD